MQNNKNLQHLKHINTMKQNLFLLQTMQMHIDQTQSFTVPVIAMDDFLVHPVSFCPLE